MPPVRTRNRDRSLGACFSARIASPQSSTSTSMANVTGLALPLAAGKLYAVRALVPFSTVITTTGIRLGITHSGLSSFAGHWTVPQTTDNTNSMRFGLMTSSGDSVVSATVEAADTPYLAVFDGVMRVGSSPGSVQVTMGTEVNLSAATVRAGACLMAWEVG